LSAEKSNRDEIRVEEVPRCPMCDGLGPFVYEGLRDRYWDAPGVWSYRRCTSCSHLWLDPRPIREDVGKLYASYFTHGIERPDPFTGDGIWPRFRRGVMESLGYPGIVRDRTERLFGRVARLVPPVWEECEELCRSVAGPPRGVLLDVGCGDGTYLRTMRDLGWKVRGLEPDARAASVARAQGLDVIEGAVESSLRDREAYDVITMTHVIEHVVDPAQALATLRDALRPGGTLLLITPNAGSLGHRRFGASWYHLDPPRHLQLFTVANLAARTKAAGLEILRWRTTGRGHLVYDASRSIERTGRFDLRDPSRQASRGDQSFRLFEEVLLLAKPDWGEEILLFATKSAS
jgi:2-polyprenyl-3-methyl-5-hydroxy-6-metoxy-1,4-benzoquinol methylase